MSKTLCIIPARGGSKRFPGKNVALLNGKPLLAYAIEVAKASGVFDAVCVSSDDPRTLTIAREYGADIIHDRPADLATDAVQLKTLCKHLLEELSLKGTPYDTFALLIPVSPLRTAEDIRKAYALLQSSDAHTVMSVMRYSHPVQLAVCIRDGYLKPFFGSEHLKPAQKLEPLYRHDGTVIFCKTDAFLREGDFYGSKVIPYVVPPERSVNIDEPMDLQWAEFLLSRSS